VLYSRERDKNDRLVLPGLERLGLGFRSRNKGRNQRTNRESGPEVDTRERIMDGVLGGRAGRGG
jgi:hypothetical protein